MPRAPTFINFSSSICRPKNTYHTIMSMREELDLQKQVSRAVGGSASSLPLMHRVPAGGFDKNGARLTEAEYEYALLGAGRQRLHGYSKTAMTWSGGKALVR